MITTISGVDIPQSFQTNMEAQGIKAASQITAYSIITEINGEMVELVTQCRAGARKDWRDLLGLNLTEDIDAQWAMAWVNADGSIETAGPNLVLAKRAAANLRKYHFSGDALRVSVENTNDHDAPFAFFGETLEGDRDVAVYEGTDLRPYERAFVGELYGVEPTAPWGMAWQPVSIPCATGEDGENPEPEFHRVIVAVGTSTEHAYQAFRDLAVCN
ncbi:MAG TPA: hypothetical protein VJM32_06705 [Candidatus Saccharimonadales bacterium]|nr:hypothetical protein [Candidatus Saccharimonadales bacterium]